VRYGTWVEQLELRAKCSSSVVASDSQVLWGRKEMDCDILGATYSATMCGGVVADYINLVV
jgi:hypothetical protein